MQDYLQKETAANDKAFKRGLVITIVIAAVVTGYFQWMKAELAPVITPTNLANFAVEEVERNLPQAEKAIEQNMREAMPEFVQFTMNTIVEESVPQIRASAEKLFKDHTTEVVNLAVVASTDVFESVVAKHKAELAERAQAEPGFYTDPSFLADLDADLKAEAAKRWSERPQESTAYKLEAAAVALRNIDRKLEEMASATSTTREDQLKKRLISTWWTYLKTVDMGSDDDLVHGDSSES